MLVAFYVHYHGNSAELYMQLQPDQYFMCWSIEYCQDALLDLKDRKLVEISINDLPDEIKNDFDFNRNRDRVREVYKLS